MRIDMDLVCARDVDRVRFLGLLAVARTVPILKAMSSSMSDTVDRLGCTGLFHLERHEVGDTVQQIHRLIVDRLDGLDGLDNYHSSYVEYRILKSARILIEFEWDAARIDDTVFQNIRDVWGQCDFFIDWPVANGDSVLRALRTTLLGVENEWRWLDEDAWERSTDVYKCYLEQYAAIHDPRRYGLRCEIAQKVARLAGWAN